MRKRTVSENDRPRLTAIELISTAIGIALLFALGVTLLLLLAGCASEDSATGSPADSRAGSAIAFSVGDSTARAATRAAQGTIDLAVLRTKGFGVFACHTGAHPYVSTTTRSNLMHNQLVTYDNGFGVWTYTPLVYWPNGTTGDKDYVTFFAYAPHSDLAGGCIADMSRSDETGDPWILYQLGGTETDWKSSQVDLLYDFKKDQQKGDSPSVRVDLNFKHALAALGDRITVTCDESVAERLKGVYEGTPVTLTVNRVTIDYQLTRKGRLVLNGSTQPNWQAVESEDAKVHRTLTFTPNLVMAQATSATAADINTFDSGTGHGIFYIPVESGTDKQRATVTIGYTISSGSPAEVTEEGSAESTIDLSFVSNPSEGRDLNITFRIP